MSWCGGGEIRPTPGVEWRTLAMVLSTLCPGNWPPSPGFAPCAILICITSELTRYSAVTPKRPEATCLIADRIESTFGSGLKRSDSSPPSPVFDLPPMRFMAIASVVWASREIEPNDMAPVENRHDGLGRLDFFQGDRFAAVFLGLLEAEHPADGQQPLVLLVHDLRKGAVMVLRIATHRVLQVRHCLRGPHVVLAAYAHGVVAADIEHRAVDRRVAEGIAMPA